MRRFSRWLLRRRRAMWLEELEEGIRKQDAFTFYRYARLLAGTSIGSKHRRFVQNSSLTPLLRQNGHKVWQKKGQREGLALEYTWTIWSFWSLAATRREEARADYNRTQKQLRRAPARRSCLPWSIPGRLWLLLMWSTFLRRKSDMTHWDTSRPLVHS